MSDDDRTPDGEAPRGRDAEKDAPGPEGVKPESEPEAVGEQKPERAASSESGPEEAEPEAEAKPEPASEAKPDPEPEPESEAAPEPEPERKPEPEPERKPKPEPESAPEPGPKPDAERAGGEAGRPPATPRPPRPEDQRRPGPPAGPRPRPRPGGAPLPPRRHEGGRPPVQGPPPGDGRGRPPGPGPRPGMRPGPGQGPRPGGQPPYQGRPPHRPPQGPRPAPPHGGHQQPFAPGSSRGRAGHESGAGGPDRLTGRQRLAKSIWPPRVSRAQLIVALLLFVLGLGLAIQVRSTSENSALRGARQEDLVRILDELDDRTKRLEEEKQSLERQRTELDSSSDQAEEARKQTLKKQRQLGVLAGTVGAQGPGIALTVTDPSDGVQADSLLDTVQELRAAGAEAIEINDVRVVADTYFSEGDGGVLIDGRRVTPPYRFEVIGEPKDLEPALNIPGGVVQSLQNEQADVAVTRSSKIVVDAVRPANKPRYIGPSTQ